MAEGKGNALRRVASLASLTVACVLIGVKFWAWISTGSVALLTSAMDALVDGAAALATFVGVRYAQQGPDRLYRWGYGKGEALAALMQALFLAGAAIALSFQAIQRLIRPEPLDAISLGLWIIGASMAAAGGLVLMQSWVLRKTPSTAIAADRTHYLADIAVNLAVLAALAVTTLTGWQRADPAFALAISAYMVCSARGIATEALRQLLDRELATSDRERIKEAVLAVSGARVARFAQPRCGRPRIY
jgi:cation diffusion facilitator family transporter